MRSPSMKPRSPFDSPPQEKVARHQHGNRVGIAGGAFTIVVNGLCPRLTDQCAILNGCSSSTTMRAMSANRFVIEASSLGPFQRF